MSNLFDGLQDKLFDTVKTVFGYVATWTPSVGGAERTTSVLFREPTDEEKVINETYNPNDYYLEFREGDSFSSDLFNASRQGLYETVTIDIRGTSRNFAIMSITSAFDGRTFKARIEEII